MNPQADITVNTLSSNGRTVIDNHCNLDVQAARVRGDLRVRGASTLTGSLTAGSTAVDSLHTTGTVSANTLSATNLNANAASVFNLTALGTITADTVIANTIRRPLAVPAATPDLQRQSDAYDTRVNSAYAEYQVPLPTHSTNGDEALYANKIGNYSKGLAHNGLGEVDLSSYAALITAVTTGQPSDFDAIPMGNAHAKLTNPQAGLAFDLEGADSWALFEQPPPALASQQRADETVELYWQALLRDVNFADYGTGTNTDSAGLSTLACTELSGLGAFNGPKVAGAVTPATLFRSSIPGSVGGPWGSQFMYLACPFGAVSVNQKMTTIDPVASQAASGLPTPDYMTNYSEWLNIENGAAPTHSLVFDGTARYVRNARDMAQYVHLDVLCQQFYQAMLILFTFCPFNVGNPYNTSTNQSGFGLFGNPHISGLLPEGCYRALCKQWFQKWFVHRCLRPEAYGGLVHNTLTGAATYPIHPDCLTSTAVATTFSKTGSYLLPQAYPEGSPYHPSYGSGHATVSGFACTILKAFFNGNTVIPSPVQPSADGTTLVPYVGPALTVTGELNKLAYNVATGRAMAGIHYRSDSDNSLLLGEAMAIAILRDQRATYNENFAGFTFQKFDGTTITV